MRGNKKCQVLHVTLITRMFFAIGFGNLTSKPISFMKIYRNQTARIEGDVPTISIIQVRSQTAK